jgi:predicted DsbA family dithiol-disulfide isomerase
LIYPAQPSYAARLAAKYRLPLARAEEMLKEMTERGQPEGIAFNWDKLVGVNTFLAHQLQCFARVEAQAGRAPAAAALRLNELVFKWYFTDGRNLSAPETLVQLATDAGFSESSARAALNDPQYFNLVRADESEAQELGITGVPFFVIGRYGVSGAQTSDVLVNVLQKAWDESQEPVEVDGTEGSCEVEGECS